jgi:Na+/H+ antiporter
MVGLEIVVVLLTAVLGLGWIARRLGLSEPVLLLLGGVLIGVIPHFRTVHLPGDVVLLIFLPPLLYAEALSISLHQIRANLRVIVLLSVGLVLVTALTVAITGHGFGLAWPMAFVLGAVLAPTDATAVASVVRDMPRRLLTTLRAESLVNDGTALAIFAVAVDIAIGRHDFSWGNSILRFLLSYAGGIAIGAAVALVVVTARRRLADSAIESGLSVLTPFAAYLPAELADVSGVLAVVSSGLIVSRASPVVTRAASRIKIMAFWDVTSFLLNGSLFVLVGVQLPRTVLELRSLTLREAGVLAAVVSAAVIATRLLFLHTTPYMIRALDRRRRQRAKRVGIRQRMPAAWGGVRGAISLAAALAVPTATTDGTRLHGRDVVVFVTSAVIVVTLLIQGQTLPAMVRWSRQPADSAEEDEELLARRHMLDDAREALDGEAARVGAPRHVVDRLADELEENADRLRRSGEPAHFTENQLRQALIAVKRDALVGLRDARRIDDVVLRRVLDTLDTEERRLELRIAADRAMERGQTPADDGDEPEGRG